MSNNQELAQIAVSLCRRRGADQAEALVIDRTEKAVEVFNGRPRLSGASQVTSVTLRLFRNQRGAVVTGRGSSERALENLIEAALATSRYTSPDKFLGLGDAGGTGPAPSDLGIYDDRLAELPLNSLEKIASSAESAVARKDSRTANLITSSFQVQNQHVTLCTSRGFCESYQATTGILLIKAILENLNGVSISGSNNSEKFSAYAGNSVRSLDKLDIGNVANRTVERLASNAGARPTPGGWFPVVFAPSAANVIVSTLLASFSGAVVLALGKSPLGAIGKPVCSPLITLVDDPGFKGGTGTAPFDHEGVRPRRNVIIENGVLREYLLNSYCARALQRRTTGNALSSDDARFDVSASNGHIEAGSSTPESIIADVRRGLYVTGFLSYVLPLATNFSQGVTGFWIEEGELTYPVRAATVSAGMSDMIENIVAVGDDLNSRMRFNSPTLMVSKMSVNSLT